MTSEHVTVYVVEDSPLMCKLLTEMIEETGATVIGHADTATSAIQDIAKLHPDAVTIDIALHQGTGFDVLKGIAISCERPPLRIVVTNYVTDAYRETAKRLGAEHFFDKARQITELIALLTRSRNRPSAIGA